MSQQRIAGRLRRALSVFAGQVDAPDASIRSEARAALPARVAIFCDDVSDVLDGRYAGFCTSASHVLVGLTGRGTSSDEAKARLTGFSNVTLCVSPGMAAVHRAMSATAPFDVVIDATLAAPEFRRRLAKNALFYLVSGGRYLIDGGLEPQGRSAGPDAVTTVLSAFDASRLGGSASNDEERLGAAIKSIAVSRSGVEIVKTASHLRKLRDSDATAVLSAARGEHWGQEEELRAASAFRVKLDVSSNRFSERFPASFEVPARATRRYRDVTCHHGQVAVVSGFVLPDSFRRPTQRRLHNRHLAEASPDFVVDEFCGAVDREANGPFFYIDTEYPDHFGHVTTEVIARLADYCDLRRSIPDLRPVISAKKSGQPARFVIELLEALGVALDTVLVIGPGESVKVSELWASTPRFSQPYWVDPSLASFWDELRARFGVRESDIGKDGPLFASRRSGPTRSCRNAVEVEDLFSSFGYDVVYPEQYTFRDQVRMFARASAVSAFAGSNAFQMMFSGSVPRVLVAGDSYTALNEYMISAVRGGSVHYSYHDSEHSQPVGGWSAKAFHSNFYFDATSDPDLGAKIRESVS